MSWHALDVATRHDAAARVAFSIDGRVVGSVARRHLQALEDIARAVAASTAHNAAPLRTGPHGVELVLSRDQRTSFLSSLNVALRDAGHIAAWRDETYAISDPHSLEALALIERAASRFWGTLTFGAHANGYVKGLGDRPTHLWIARRAMSKATEPGLFDNLIGGGVAYGQSPLEALVREGWEEAGLMPAQLASAAPGNVLRLARDVPHGFQHEWLHSFDLALPDGLTPTNQDGEVEGFTLMPIEEALALAASPRMTVDAGLVTLDFALRHGLIEPADELSQRIRTLRIIRNPEARHQDG